MRADLNSNNKIRLDQALVVLGLAASRNLALRMIESGQVTVQFGPQDPISITKPSYFVCIDDGLTKIVVNEGEANKFVSRGGLKLESALKYFMIDCTNFRVLDVGISTGGFADCVLQRGAREVIGLDVGHNQLAAKLRNDARVLIHEGINARNLSSLNWLGKFDLIVVDVSFISLTKILPEVVRFLNDSGRLLTLVKPQFELGPEALNKKGIVREENRIVELKSMMISAFEGNELEIDGLHDCPVRGTDGNQEFFILSYRRNTTNEL